MTSVGDPVLHNHNKKNAKSFIFKLWYLYSLLLTSKFLLCYPIVSTIISPLFWFICWLVNHIPSPKKGNEWDPPYWDLSLYFSSLITTSLRSKFHGSNFITIFVLLKETKSKQVSFNIPNFYSSFIFLAWAFVALRAFAFADPAQELSQPTNSIPHDFKLWLRWVKKPLHCRQL